jgi:hypothetical protein
MHLDFQAIRIGWAFQEEIKETNSALPRTLLGSLKDGVAMISFNYCFEGMSF